MDSIIGIVFQNWYRLLKENRFKVDHKNFIKALVITFLSLKNSRQKNKEDRKFRQLIDSTSIDEPPLFILGHWRSGTTFLHNLISTDQQFAFPNLFEVRNPHSFLSKQHLFEKRLQLYKAQKRKMDNMQIALDSPLEEEFAVAVMSLRSPLIGWMFPQNAKNYDKYVTFDDAPEQDLQIWKEWYLLYLKKLTYKYQKPLLLKSPLNTARIGILLTMFPNARFIHIHRHPLQVFKSTKKLYNSAIKASHMYNFEYEDLDRYIIDGYNEIYHAFFRDLPEIKEDRYYEIAFEDLEAKPVDTVRTIYDALKMPFSDNALSQLKDYVSKHSNYKKNVYNDIPDKTKQLIFDKWQQNFKRWGYSLS
ncbi:MAG: hypothetical protein GF313_10360 [Caldithrix sp.]|nr:hypothetical protein [Caldithrix sp.]